MKNKITKEELDALVNANRVYRDLKSNLADIEMHFWALKEQKELTIPRINEAQRELANQQKAIYDKYGDVSVNLQTGEYN
jgi:diphthamide biosynthesis methyltransferase